MRHVTYDRRQVNSPRSPYNRRATRHLGQNYSGRTEGSPRNRRQLNPQVSEFDPTARSSRSDSKFRTSKYDRQRVKASGKLDAERQCGRRVFKIPVESDKARKNL